MASATLATLTIGSSIFLGLALYRSRAASSWVAHTHEVIAAAQAVARDALEAQSGFRGFLLSNDRSFLDQYAEGNAQFGRDIEHLVGLLHDNAPQVMRASKLQEGYQLWRDGTARPLIESASSAGLTASQRATILAGKQQIDALRAVIDELVRTEEQLLVLRQRADELSGRGLAVGSLAAISVLVVFGIGGALLFTRRVVRRLTSVTLSADAIARGELSHRIPAEGADELSVLGRSFNEMATQLEDRDHEVRVTTELREMLHAAPTLSEARRIIAALVPQCLPSCSGRLFLLNPSRTLLAPAASWGDAPGDEAFPPDACWSFRRGRPHIVGIAGVAGVACEHRTPTDRLTACVPLMAHGDAIGLMHLVLEQAAVPRVAVELGEMIALTVANLRLREAMRDQATRDPLTGLFNRRYLEETLPRELARSKRSNAPMSVVMLDVDHFKRFNDMHGHAAGDVVLQEVASVLRKTFRSADVVCRYGGEEFLVLMPDCSQADAVARTETVRSAVHGLHVMHDGRALESVTLSGGVATHPVNASEEQHLVHAADEALYRSKREGRDRVSVSQDASPAIGAVGKTR